MAKRSKLDEEEVAKLMLLIARVRAGASLGEIAETVKRHGHHASWRSMECPERVEGVGRAQEARSEL
jgi:hypothetical protein